MVQDIVFHLGDCKTGTTSIQTVLARGTWEAEGRTLLYSAPFNHIPLAKSLRKRGIAQNPQVDGLVAALQASDADLAVISAEHFEFVPPKLLHDLVEGPLAPWRDRVRLIAYVRPHAERFLSAFAEGAKKGGLTGDLAATHQALLARRLLFYAPRFAALRDLFGDRFTLRPFLRDQLKDGDVVADFFDFALRGAPVRFTGEAAQNESLSVEDLVLVRLMQAEFRRYGADIREPGKAFGRNFSAILAAAPAQRATKLQLHRALADELAATYADDAAAVDAQFFDAPLLSARLDLARAGALDAPQSLDPEEYHDPGTLRFARANAALYARLMAHDPEGFRWGSWPEEFEALKTRKSHDPLPPPGIHPRRAARSAVRRLRGRVSRLWGR